MRDPWGEDDAADAEPGEHTHDPHEVTVQLDSVQFADGVLRRTPGGQGSGPEPSEGPVFVDESGRRGRRYRRIGLTVGLACAGYAVVIVATLLSGNSDAPWLPVPGQQQDTPAGKVETSPDPAESDGVPGSGASLGPGSLPDTGDLTLPTPGASLPAPGVTAPRQDADGARTTAPAPGSTGRATKPAPGGTTAPTSSAEPATPVAPPPAESPAEEPPPVTTEPAGGGGGDGGGGGGGADTDDVAGAPAGPPVVAAGPDAPPAAPDPSDPPAAPSPEHVL